VAADEPLLVFPSAQDAQGYLEAIDVVNGVYPVAYGREGQPYNISADGNRVLVERAEGPADPDALRALLVGYLKAHRQTASRTAPLSELAATVWKLERWELHGPRYSPWSCLLVVLAIGALLVVVFKLA
jgi:hypothetical protein